MRTTLSIDDDVLDEARALAEHQNRALGEVVSALMRRALARPPEPRQYRNGIPILPRRGGPRVTLELVNKLRDELP
jgi:hypothetical protein